jgi:predicted dehydrogenase
MAAKRTQGRRAQASGKQNVIRCGLIGCGGRFGMARLHAQYITATPGLEPVALCDIDPRALAMGHEVLPDLETYSSVAAMLRKSNPDMVTIITPHNTHAQLAVQCARAGKHVVVEKPMCITVAEADRMIQAAKDNQVMLSVFHNRRFDGDFMTLRDIIGRGLIGDVFHVEAYMGSYGHPGTWWRSNKRISGGAMYDWGAHYLDWLLNLVPAQMESVTGYIHKLVWRDVTNEDQVRAIIRFRNGAVAELQISHIAAVGKDRWRILGTKGGIRDGRREKHFLVATDVAGLRAEMEVPYQEQDWEAYYRNLADHLLRGKELAVKPEEARRVIAVLEAAEKSARTGKAVKPKYA